MHFNYMAIFVSITTEIDKVWRMYAMTGGFKVCSDVLSEDGDISAEWVFYMALL